MDERVERDQIDIYSVSLDGAVFEKSPYSGANGGQCVEVATNVPGIIAVRDSKNPNGPVLRFTPGEWDAFQRAIGDGLFRPTA
ncbi:DUF397 domain-containing protein [Streptosporangium saharense]|uniref:DUF397 domain-containing protein n=1 Tax=Streptosporangium saharense TaxID=1706840 RepID=UPI003680C5D5